MQASADKLVRDLRVVVQDAEDLIKATAGDIQERTREARAKLAGALVVAKETLNQSEQAASRGLEAARLFLREHPLECLAGAFVTGVLLGLVATRPRE